ncbi:DNA gyrase subunit A [Pirellula sp. SH-Sr6A]|uniref:DNA gyrase subunit A n=1 Tax=Pirellula sp. SH-Sr6A TaxID=1632865 RepID=UPI0011BA5601|nr:DNA gyrase subunit A [Pirellula sp. SH-Sr6A]
MIEEAIEDELRNSYLTYAMSVIVSRALPDVRDGLKPSQRRILVAMNDLSLTPGAARVKCAKIAGDTSGNYHPHGEAIIYPTLVRMAQEWNMRHVLIDKQGNFGSIAGLPAAAMRYTEARLAPPAAMMLDDLKLDTVDYIPTYDERRTEPVVLPSKFPNLLVNGAQGIAVGMATSIPPHNLREICAGLIRMIEDPEISISELCEIVPGPDFPTGGIICGRYSIRQAYNTGRSTIVVRARVDVEEGKKARLIVREIPFQQARDRVVERIADLVRNDKIKGISGIRDESDLKEPVRIVIELKQGHDPHIVLNQLYQFSSLQETHSIILLALVDGKPRELTLKEMMQEFLRHRVIVIRRRTQFLLASARKRKHVVEGLLLALADIDHIIQIIRNSRTQAEAKEKLMGVECPASMMERALGDRGYTDFQLERGISDTYRLTSVQTDAILRMTLGQLAGLEQERLAEEHSALLDEISEYRDILGDPVRIYGIIRADLEEISRRYGTDRKTVIDDEELGNYNMEDLITEETMVVTISTQGYIKRIPATTYRAQKRGGKGIAGMRAEEEDPVEHLFVASTHAYLLFFTNQGKVYWQKVWEIPQMSRESRGRAVVNLLNLSPDEKIRDCVVVRNFDLPGHFLMMGTKKGIVKKTELEAYSRPKRGGIIAIKLREDDELVDVVITKPNDQIVLSTSTGMAIRFSESDARPMGRNTSGVKGISLRKGDEVVGMVVADPTATLLTACEFGYGKRTTFGPGDEMAGKELPMSDEGSEEDGLIEEEVPVEEPEAEDLGSANRYRTQRRGGKGVIDIKATRRNGKVVGIAAVHDSDEVLMMTTRGKIQRIAVKDVSVIGRNTQGVRIMSLDEGDSLTAIVRVPSQDIDPSEIEAASAPIAPVSELPIDESLPESTSESDVSDASEGE